jgi:endo-alpha-1,4-polygalactosaminidase (GH114 family)
MRVQTAVGAMGYAIGLFILVNCSGATDSGGDAPVKPDAGLGGRGSGGNGSGGSSGGSSSVTGAGGANAGSGPSSTGAGGTDLDAGHGGASEGGAGGEGGGAGTGGGKAGSASTGGGKAGSGGGAPGGAGGSTDSGTSGVWQPPSGTTWQWQLTGTIDTSVDAAMYDIDLFDAPPATIDNLHAAGRVVICYFSAGTYEDWRPDASSFPASALGNGVAGWPGEKWVDTRDATVRQILTKRLDMAVEKKCNGVEPDNVDGYQNNPGFPLTSATQLDFDRFLATEAHARALSVGLKNDVDQAATLEPSFDWALNEECSKYSECSTLAPFTKAGKAVFHAEYATSCPAAVAGFSTILKHLELDAWRTVCP